MDLTIINGPNLNLVGKREPAVYGRQSFADYLKTLKSEFPGITLEAFQSNVEGELINAIQDYGFRTNGIIINPGGYSHTSVAIADAIKAVPVKVIEVHISHVLAREDFRKILITAAAADGFISGLGLDVYRLALLHFISENR